MAANPKTENRIPEGGSSQHLLTSRDVAALLGVCLRTVQRMIHDEESKPVRVRGGAVRFRREDVTEVVRNGGRKWGRKAALAGHPEVAA